MGKKEKLSVNLVSSLEDGLNGDAVIRDVNSFGGDSKN